MSTSATQFSATRTSDVSDLPERAAALSRRIRERADEATIAGTVPADVIGLLESEGMFRMALPRGLGGLEADPVSMVRSAEALAHADGSSAWTVMLGNLSLLLAWLDQDVAASLLGGRPGQPVSASFAPNGRGVEENGGYRVSGRWRYVSGSPHAGMLVLCFVVTGSGGAAPGERPVLRFGVVPADAVQVVSTWNDAAGMRGSGSHDVVVDGVYVAAECTLMPFFEPPVANGALYRMPFFTIIRSLIVGVPLGAARRALDELTAFCQNKIRDSAPLVEDQDVQIRLAEAEAALRAGRTYVLEMTERTWAAAREGREVSHALRTEYTLAAQFAMRSAVRVVDLAFEIAGVSAALSGDVIQRCWRDVNVASQHATFSRNRWRGAGKALLGLETDPLYL